ncbi:MAG: hypothetical protein V1855_01335 [bacterium]
MVLGAGDQDKDYTRFKGYTFLVSPDFDQSSKKLVTSEKDLRSKYAKEPIFVPLDFNYKSFFDFLKSLKGSFKQIIFDGSVTKFVESWKLSHLKTIFESLQPGGEFYTDLGGGALGGAAIGSIQRGQFSELSLKNNRVVVYTFSDSFFPKRYLVWYSKKKQVQFPTQEKIVKHMNDMLQKAGFDVVEYRENKPYPADKAWESTHNFNFKEYTYLYAKKAGGPKKSSLQSITSELVKKLTELSDTVNNLGKTLKGVATLLRH